MKDLIHQVPPLTYLDDFVLIPCSKPNMLRWIKQLQEYAEKENPKLTREKISLVLLIVKYLGHKSGLSNFKSIQSKTTAIHKYPSSITEIELMPFIGSINFYFKHFCSTVFLLI